MLEKNDDRDKVIISRKTKSKKSKKELIKKNNKVIGAVCEDFSIWGPMFRVSSDDVGKWESFKSDMYLYAKDNLMRINMYIRYVRSFQTLICQPNPSWI